MVNIAIVGLSLAIWFWDSKPLNDCDAWIGRRPQPGHILLPSGADIDERGRTIISLGSVSLACRELATKALKDRSLTALGRELLACAAERNRKAA